MNRKEVTDHIRVRAGELGFTLCGVCPAVSPQGIDRFREWLQSGYAGEMTYFAERKDAYIHPRYVLDGVRSLVMLGLPYQATGRHPATASSGQISAYAWSGTDYHDVIHKALKSLRKYVASLLSTDSVRGVVDTAPLLEREFARLAGLGWFGKNTMLINRHQGSYFFLSALLVDRELDYDRPFEANHCGTCTACLDACPTDAFPQPYLLDARRCISYLTIELRSQVPVTLREPIGSWLFGCDVCQQVCPWNHHPTATRDLDVPAPLDQLNPADLVRLFDLDEDAFRQEFRRSPMWRPRRRGLLRNAALVLGNQCTGHASSDRAIEALGRGLRDAEPLVRGASAWALGQIGGPAARRALLQQLEVELDPEVKFEITEARRGPG